MFKDLEIKFTMYNTVIRFFSENETAVSTVEELGSNRDALVNTTTAIGTKEDQRMNAKKGRTKAKASARYSVTLLAVSIAGAVFAFAKKTGNILLVSRADISVSRLDGIRDSELPIILRSVRDLANENLSSLGRFGVTPEMLTDYESKITDYVNALSGKDSSGALKSGALKSLRKLFKEADDILLSTDRLVSRFRDSNIQFYNSYKSARKLVHTGVRHRKAKTTAPSVVTGQKQVTPELQSTAVQESQNKVS